MVTRPLEDVNIYAGSYPQSALTLQGPQQAETDVPPSRGLGCVVYIRNWCTTQPKAASS